MKNIIYLLFFFISITIQGQISFEPKISADWFVKPYSLLIQSPDMPPLEVNMGSFRFQTGGDIIYKKAGISFNQQVYVRDYHKVAFRPTNIKWDFGVFLNITDKIKISYEHSCWHPVEIHRQPAIEIYGGYRKISLSYGY